MSNSNIPLEAAQDNVRQACAAHLSRNGSPDRAQVQAQIAIAQALIALTLETRTLRAIAHEIKTLRESFTGTTKEPRP
jgi:hypothetical protein